MVTFFKSNFEIDEEAIRNHIDFLIGEKVHGIFAGGSLGEFTHLSYQEREKLAEIVVEHTYKRIPVLIGAGSTSTDETIKLAKHAENIGADAVVIITPYYFKLKPKAIYQHYKTIANAIGIPIIIYNYPAVTGIDMDPALIAKLAKIPNIIGIKDTTVNMFHLARVINLSGGDFSVLSGSEDILLPLLAIGGHGTFSGIGNIAPSLPVSVYNAFKEGNLKKALEYHKKIIKAREILNIGQTPITPLKEALKLMRKNIEPIVRKPLLPLTLQEREKLKKKLKELNYLNHDFT